MWYILLDRALGLPFLLHCRFQSGCSGVSVFVLLLRLYTPVVYWVLFSCSSALSPAALCFCFFFVWWFNACYLYGLIVLSIVILFVLIICYNISLFVGKCYASCMFWSCCQLVNDIYYVVAHEAAASWWMATTMSLGMFNFVQLCFNSLVKYLDSWNSVCPTHYWMVLEI